MKIDSEKPLVQNDDLFVNDPNLTPGFLQGTRLSLERIRTEMELVESGRNRQV